MVPGVDVGVWATAAPPQNTRMAAMRAPTEADTLEILEPGLLFMLIPCWLGSSTTLLVLTKPAGRLTRPNACTADRRSPA